MVTLGSFAVERIYPQGTVSMHCINDNHECISSQGEPKAKVSKDLKRARA